MRAITLFLGLSFIASTAFSSEAATKLLRFPDIHDDQLVFSYGGDLWKSSTEGGIATRLTAHPGLELFAKFSPDGQSIAFTGQYDGDEQVYVIPATGGEPTQLTFYPARGPLPPRWGYDNQVYGWTPDGKSVLFRSLRDADGIRANSNLYTVEAEGGLPVRLPMPDSGAGDLSPDGKSIVYSPLSRDFRTWKRYQGGWAQDLYRFDLQSHAVVPIAHHVRTERDPMWIGNAIYFVSDRDDTLNLYRSSLDGEKLEQLTSHSDWDVRWASADALGHIVYELGGELAIYDTRSGEIARPAIDVHNDGLDRRPARKSVAGQLEDWELSPAGERALFVARGDVFTAPIEKGPTRNLTKSSNAHDKHARWSPDGRSIAFVSDLSSEDQVYVVDQLRGEAELITDFGADTGMLFAPAWSPDSKRLAISDKNGKVFVIDVAKKSHVEVADDDYGLVSDYAWSPDSRWLAFSLTEESRNNSLRIWSAEEGQLRRVTGVLFNEYGPSWGPDGKYLYFLSQREFAPQISQAEWNFAGNRMTGVFVLALQKDTGHPFPPESDEVEIDDPSEEGDDEDGESEPRKARDKEKKGKNDQAGDNDKSDKEDGVEGQDRVRIDFDGLAARVARLPIEADNIGALAAVEGKLVYMKFGEPYYGRESTSQPSLHLFDFDSREASEMVSDVQGWALSHDGKKVLLRRRDGFEVHEVKAGSKDGKEVATAGLQVDSVPAQEWATIFDEVWRRFRDFFYVDNMHGYDWEGIGERYQTLLEHVAHRSDLNYLLGEMISELNVGHAYIAGGDFDLPDRPSVALPGARFELDRNSNRYRIAEILAGDNAESKYRAPLTEIGVDARVGDYVLAIDGVDLVGSDNPYRLLRYKTDPVTFSLASAVDADESERRAVTFRPIQSENNLLYLAQVDRNRRWIEKESAGRVGYFHIPDMGASGAYEFIKWFYPQIRKGGLVVDVRSNGGGNISQ